MRFGVLLLLPCLLAAAPAGKPKNRPDARIEVLELTVKRTTENTVEVDGRIRNLSDKALRKLLIRFKVLAAGDEIVTTQTGAVEPEVLDAGEEAEFHWRMRDPARGVALRVEAETRDEKYIAVERPGPYVIE